MGNKICVDKKPSKIENIISFKPKVLGLEGMANLKKYLEREELNSNSYQHLNIWCLSENVNKQSGQDNGINNNSSNNNVTCNNNNSGKTEPSQQIQQMDINDNNDNYIESNICDNEPKINVTPVEIANIHKNHFLLDSHNVYVLLLIFKKDCETVVENSPFPTGLWGIIESSSNMTPRGLLFAFPATHNCQNLESFLLSKRELNDSEFKYMLFIWNGKKSTAFLRSVSLMKAFDLDKALMCPTLVHCIYTGYSFNDNSDIPPEYMGCIQLGDILNNTIENSEDNSTPSSDKINNLHETVYLFKLLYPNTKHKNKHRHSKKNKNKIMNQNDLYNINNDIEMDNNTNDNQDRNNSNYKGQNVLFKGFNNYFLVNGPKKKFYDNFTDVDINLNNNNTIEGKNINIDLNVLSNNFVNNNNLEKSNLARSNIKNNKNVVMPPKLNLNLNLNMANKVVASNSVEDTSNSKSSVSVSTSREDNKKDELINGFNTNTVNGYNRKQPLSNNREQRNVGNSTTSKGNNKNSKTEYNSERQQQSKEKEKMDDDEDCMEEEDEQDIDLISTTNNAYNNNLKSSTNNFPLKKIRVPKLMVSLQKSTISEEKLTERAKIKSEQEETFNILPESTLILTSQHIINNIGNTNNLGLAKINLGNLPSNIHINSEKVIAKTNIQDNGANSETINIKALNEDYSLKDSERKKIISDYYSKHLSEIIPNFLYLSSYNAAKNRDLLEKNKITHIINCAADFCENVFEQENKYTYLSFFLKDHVLENIECLFYDCIKFIESVKEKGGRVLVHCIQGISRSVSIVMAYLIYKKKVSYDKAFSIVQSKREISSPNFGFSIQLQNFYMRLFEDPSKYRYIPKIFAVGSFQNEQPDKIVCRLMNEPFYEHKENGLPRMLDKRGLFIIVSLTNVYLWVGSKILPSVKDLYFNATKEYLNNLKQYEQAPLSNNGPIMIYDGKETDEFINELLKTKEKISRFKQNISDIFPEWNSWYKELKNGGNKITIKEKNKSNNNLIDINDSKNTFSNIVEVKKGFFLYPNDKSDAVLDFDDLSDETFLVACIYQKSIPRIYLWKGKSVDINENVYNEYKNKVAKIFFNQYNLTDEQYNKIDCIIETPLEESDEFLSLI